MIEPVTFTSWLAPYLRRFVALKRTGGSAYKAQERLLRAFDGHVRRHVKPPLSRAALMDYLETKVLLGPRSRDNLIAVIWPALAHAKRHGAAVVDLPPRPPKPVMYLRQRPPRILTADEFSTLLTAAAQLAPTDSYRPVTATTLLGLLWVTGIRIGEALALDVGDLDVRDRLLTVRAGKFGKSRILPLRESTVAALVRYLHHRLRRTSTRSSAPLFVSLQRRRLCRDTFAETFVQAWAATSLAGPRPRVHDLRHAFAVGRVARWYAAGREVNALLPALSTYLGHVSVQNTRLYLVANGALLQAAAGRFALGTAALDQVQP